MNRQVRRISALAVLVAACALVSGSATAANAAPAPSQASPDEGEAWILVDADRRLVLDGRNVHKPRPPANRTLIVVVLGSPSPVPFATPAESRERGMRAR